jgi:predicted  nucleic acid-binding Zn-ribbon protein
MRKAIPFFIVFALVFGNLVLAKDSGMNGSKMGEDIIQQIPQPQFISPLSGAKISGKVEVKIKVRDAKGCEFYLRKIQSLIPIYLGRGVQMEEDTWTFLFDSSLIPNAQYYLFPQIENQYGKYEGEGIKITIENPIEKKEDITQEVIEIQKEIKKEETKTQELKENTTQEITGEYQNLIQETKEIVGEELKEKEPLIEETLKTSTEEVVDKMEQFTQKTAYKAQLEKEIERKVEEKKNLEEKIKTVEEELAELSKKQPVEPQVKKALEDSKKDKNYLLGFYKEQAEKIEKELDSLKKELEKIEKEKENIKKEITQETTEVIKPISETVEDKEMVRRGIEEIVKNVQQKVDQKLHQLEKEIAEREKIKVAKTEIITKDSDNDGLSDLEEIRLGTDPFNPDSDGDSYLDGVEREAGFDPLNPSPADKIVYETPDKTKAPISEIYKVERVEMVDLPTGEKGLKIEGKGLPKTFVTIYIYSLPLILVTKTDEAGRFVYVLDKPIGEGYHRIYVAVTNNRGNIVERSEVFHFLKTPTAVAALLPPVLEEEVISPAQALQRTFTLLVVSIIILALAIALVIIGILTGKKKKIS